MGFITGFLGGMLLGGGTVLLNNKRTGHENSQRAIDYVTEVRDGTQEFKEATVEVKDQVKNLMDELTTIKTVLAPGVEESVANFTDETDFYMRQINRDVKSINDEIDEFKENTQ